MIELLPSNIANQIAAGEVVQRGASIVKELVENAIDAGASRVVIRVEDGGRTLIQVTDNGSGMSVEDAPKAFLRHATSKIKTIEELFALRTFGFRGEALASIASVAEVELITRREKDEVGVRIVMRDGVEVERAATAWSVGTSITVRNLFYSVPARRKFLKSDAYESKLCKTEFIRIALINDSVGFEYYDGGPIASIQLMPQNRLARIVALTRASYAKKLLGVDVDSPLISLSGYIATPDTAKAKGRGEQYLFVNGRYFRNNRIFKAISDAYGRLLGGGYSPNYFLYIDVEPSSIDVNINPTKTEVKFEEEDSIVQIIASAVKRTLGRHNIVEAIDFESSVIDIPTFKPHREFVAQPTISSGVKYDPFQSSNWDSDVVPEDFDVQQAHFDEGYMFGDLAKGLTDRELGKSYVQEGLIGEPKYSSVSFSAFETSNTVVESSLWGQNEVEKTYSAVQFGSNRYLALQTAAVGLTIINIGRARQRIEYERVMSSVAGEPLSSQLLAIPLSVELSVEQKSEVLENSELYASFGFNLSDDGGSSIAIASLPIGFAIEDFVELISDGGRETIDSRVAMLLTNNISKQGAMKLSQSEIEALVERLMNCEEPSYTPTGRKVIEVIAQGDIDNIFKR